VFFERFDPALVIVEPGAGGRNAEVVSEPAEFSDGGDELGGDADL
jgi:hypothetical protein